MMAICRKILRVSFQKKDSEVLTKGLLTSIKNRIINFFDVKNTVHTKRTKFYHTRDQFSKFIHQAKEFQKVAEVIKPISKVVETKQIAKSKTDIENSGTILSQEDLPGSNPKSRIPQFWIRKIVSVQEILNFSRKLSQGKF